MTEPKTTINKGMVESDVKLDGKTVVITGCNTGIGFENVLQFAKRGARVVMACRDTQKAEEAKAKALEQVKEADIVVKQLDLASLESVRACAKDINETESRIDVLLNNAGMMMCPQWKTKDGFEMQFGVNHIGHFLFTNLLLDLIKKSAPSRIVIVSSLVYKLAKMNWNDIMHEKKYDPVAVYNQSKLANILFCKELAKRLEGTGVTTYCLHPGVVSTDALRHTNQDTSHIPIKWRVMLKIFGLFNTKISPLQGSQTSMYCAIAPELEKESGKYYEDCKEKPLESVAEKMDDAKRLWELSEELTKEEPAVQQEESKDDAGSQKKNAAAPEDNKEPDVEQGKSDIDPAPTPEETKETTQTEAANEEQQEKPHKDSAPSQEEEPKENSEPPKEE